MNVIKTKYIAPSNTRGSRIKASMNKFSVSIPYPHEFNYDELSHFQAVKALVLKHDLQVDIDSMGFGSDDNGYYFTFKHSVING